MKPKTATLVGIKVLLSSEGKVYLEYLEPEMSDRGSKAMADLETKGILKVRTSYEILKRFRKFYADLESDTELWIS